MSYTFQPVFKKEISKTGSMRVVEISSDELRDIIEEVTKNPHLLNLLISYVRKYRSSGEENREEELSNRSMIFTELKELISERNCDFLLFSGDIAEELFHRIELGSIQQ